MSVPRSIAVLLVVFLAAVSPGATEPKGWLGVYLGDESDGGVRVVAVVSGGPAARSGVREGDVLVRVNGRAVTDRETLKQLLAPIRAGDRVALELLRARGIARATVEAAMRPEWPGVAPPAPRAPMVPGAPPLVLGVRVVEIPTELRAHFGAPEDAGLLTVEVDAESIAYEAGLRVGDVVVRVGDHPVTTRIDVAGALATRNDGGTLPVSIVREKKPIELEVRLEQTDSGTLVPPSRIHGAADAAEIRARMLEERLRVLRLEIERLERQLEELKTKP